MTGRDCQYFSAQNYDRVTVECSPRGSAASGLLRCLVQPRGEAARLYASAASRHASGAAGRRAQRNVRDSNPFSRPPSRRPLQAIVRQSSF